MNKKINIKGKKTFITLKNGRIEDQESDIILNWAYKDLRSGPNSFFLIHKKAGIQLFENVLVYQANIKIIKDCDCFTTLGGDLNCKLVIHSIIPNIKNNYSICFRNISMTIKQYMKDNLCKSICIYIPEEAEKCMLGIKDFLLDLGLKEIIIVYISENEKNKIELFYSKFKEKNNINNLIDIQIEKIFNYIGNLNINLIKLWENKKMI